MRKILVILLFVLTLTACSSTKLYDSIVVSNEDITTFEEYSLYINTAINEFEYKYFNFIDLRKSTDYNNIRIRHFKKNINYTNSNANDSLLSYLSNTLENEFIFLVSYTNDTLASDAKVFLNENGFNNVIVLTMGFEGFLNMVNEKVEANTNPDIDIYKAYILEGEDCGC